MQKFLIIQTAFIGDVILATVLIEKLHSDFPGAEIDFLLRKGNEGLLKNHPYLHEVLIWNKKESKNKNLYKIIHIIRGRKYDKVINVQRFFATGLMTVLSNAKEKIGFDKNPLSFLFDVKVKHVVGTKENPVHEVDRNLSLIKHFTSDTKARMKLHPSKEDCNKIKSIVYGPRFMDKNSTESSQLKAHSYLCIAPSSVWFTKQYPKEKWIEFLQSVPTTFNLYFLGAVSDKNLCDGIISALPNHQTKNLCGELNFLESAALMQSAFMNYTNDSAPLHIASAMNAPITSVFCCTVTWFGYWPLSDISFVVEKTEPLYCRPCTSHGKKECPQKHFKCALDVKKEQLLQTLNYAGRFS